MNLTDPQIRILDCFQDDYENIEQIYRMIGKGETGKGEIEENMKILVREGYVGCYKPSDTELIEVESPDLEKIEEYWFDLTEKGENEAKR